MLHNTELLNLSKKGNVILVVIMLCFYTGRRVNTDIFSGTLHLINEKERKSNEKSVRLSNMMYPRKDNINLIS